MASIHSKPFIFRWGGFHLTSEGFILKHLHENTKPRRPDTRRKWKCKNKQKSLFHFAGGLSLLFFHILPFKSMIFHLIMLKRGVLWVNICVVAIIGVLALQANWALLRSSHHNCSDKYRPLQRWMGYGYWSVQKKLNTNKHLRVN